MKKLIQCTYCLMEALGEDTWLSEQDLGEHVYVSHPEKDFRNIQECISSWKMIGLYEERLIEE